MTAEQKIQCPKCGESISIDDVLTRQIEGKIKKEFDDIQKVKEQEFTAKSEELKKQAAKIDEERKNIDAAIEDKVADQLKAEREKIFKDAKAEAEKEQSVSTAFLEEQLKNKEEKLQKATEN